MKTNRTPFFILAAAALLFLASCGSDDTETETPVLEAEPRSIDISNDPTTEEVTITSTTTWRAIIQWEGSEEDWFTLSSSDGFGDGSFTITVDRNCGSSSRTADIILEDIQGLAGDIVTVTQSGNPSTLEVSMQDLEISDPLSAEIDITSNQGWAIVGFPEWLTITPDAGTGDATVTITATTNDTGEERESRFILRDEDGCLSIGLSVTQTP